MALEKTIGREPDVTQICPNQTLSTILFVDCTIRREKSGEDCRLFYLHGGSFERGCNSSRFTLMQENQAVFLHLTSLTPVDSGIYSCVCSHNEGTDVLHLNITVEGKRLLHFLLFSQEIQSQSNVQFFFSLYNNLEDQDASKSTSNSVPGVVIGVMIVVIITAVVSGFIYRTKCHG